MSTSYHRSDQTDALLAGGFRKWGLPASVLNRGAVRVLNDAEIWAAGGIP